MVAQGLVHYDKRIRKWITDFEAIRFVLKLFQIMVREYFKRI